MTFLQFFERPKVGALRSWQVKSRVNDKTISNLQENEYEQINSLDLDATKSQFSYRMTKFTF